MTELEKPTLIIRIRELRRERSLTQEELAEALGLSRQSVNAMEAGRCLPSLPVALDIADFFRVPLHAIFSVPGHDDNQFEDTSYQLNSTQRKEELPMPTLVPITPIREMQRMLDDLMDESLFSAPLPAVSVPAVNISQDDKNVHLEIRTPGYKTEDLNIEVGDEFVTISGEKKQEDEDKNKQYVRREFVHQSFSRTVSLPALVQGEQADASMKHGILHITIPKIVEEKPKTSKIQIKGE